MVLSTKKPDGPDDPMLPDALKSDFCWGFWVLGLQVGQAALNPSFLKAKGFNVLPMPVRVHHIAAILALMLAGFALGGCSSINEKLSSGMGDYLPHWAGGLPAGVPPRRGTPEYDAYMKEQERKRLEPAADSNAAAPASSSAQSLEPVH
jgi:hypothetical protein